MPPRITFGRSTPSMAACVAMLFLLFVLVPSASQGGAGSDALVAPKVRKLDNSGSVEVTSSVVARDDESPRDARSRAMGIARRAAVEFVSGRGVTTGAASLGQVRGSSSSNLLETLASVRADALMVEEQLLHSRTIPLAQGSFRVDVVMRGRVLGSARGGDSSFKTTLVFPKTHLVEGDEVKLSVRSSKDARIYVIGISDEGATVLLPNSFHPDTRVRAGESMDFPDKGLYERGVRLVAEVPYGKRSVREALLVVALEDGRTLDGISPVGEDSFRQVASIDSGALIADLLEPLLDIPSTAWSFDQVVYEIERR